MHQASGGLLWASLLASCCVPGCLDLFLGISWNNSVMSACLQDTSLSSAHTQGWLSINLTRETGRHVVSCQFQQTTDTPTRQLKLIFFSFMKKCQWQKLRIFGQSSPLNEPCRFIKIIVSRLHSLSASVHDLRYRLRLSAEHETEREREWLPLLIHTFDCQNSIVQWAKINESTM